MRTIFIFFTIFVITSAYRGNKRGRSDRGEPRLQQERENIPRDYYQQHQYYKNTDEDSNEYLKDDSNENSDSGSYENSDRGSYENYGDVNDEDSYEVDWRHVRLQPKPHYERSRRPYENQKTEEDSDRSSHENSDNGSYNHSDDETDEDSNDVVDWRHVRRQQKPHHDRWVGSRKAYVYWRRTMHQNSDENADNDSNDNSDNVAYEDDYEGDDPYTPKVGARFCGTH